MKIKILLVSIATILLTFSAAAQVVYDNGIHTVHNGRVNDPDFPIFLRNADDFVITTDISVTKIEWLGAYKGFDQSQNGIDDFSFEFYRFDGAVASLIPGVLAHPDSVGRSNTTQTLIYDTPVYAYSADFSGLRLDAGTYLMAIVNNPSGPNQWTWADIDAPAGHSFLLLGGDSAWREAAGGGVAEFAFVVSGSAVPEPSSTGIASLVVLAGAVTMRIRRRNSA